MEYYLMRKDVILTLCNMTSDGQMISYSPKFREPEMMPLAYKAEPDYLKRWWKERHVPLRQGRVEEMLKRKGIYEPSDYMLRNLGLSLTDYYWMKPLESDLRWRDINLFDNEFRDNILTDDWADNEVKSPSYSPNSSLRGELEKTWAIRRGRRVLIKGNHGNSSAESINEIIASELHKAQGFDNYTEYKLLRIKGKPYDYGCFSSAFTDNNLELVSAHALITSKKKEPGDSNYEHLIKTAASHGMDADRFRADLEYQIMTDYIMTNIDRHMDNIGILRDAETLKFVRMAPIFDTGRAFATGFVTPYTKEEIDNIETNSFEQYENLLLGLVTDFGRVDTSRLPAKQRVQELMSKDSKERERNIDFKLRLYEEKIRRLDKRISERK